MSNLGKVIPVTMHTINGGSGVTIAQFLEHMVVAVKSKIVEVSFTAYAFSCKPILQCQRCESCICTNVHNA